jgi:hypothetical protein
MHSHLISHNYHLDMTTATRISTLDYLIPSDSRSFGLLQPMNTYILEHAQPLTWSNWPNLLLWPIIPLGIQALLLQYEGTRGARAALGVVGLGMMLYAWAGYRFDGESCSVRADG